MTVVQNIFLPNDNSLWKATNRILNAYDQISSIIVNDEFISSDQEKAEAFADYFEKSFSIDEFKRDRRCNKDINTFLDLPLATVQLPVEFTTPKEIQVLITKLKITKNPGHDLIPTIAIKKLSPKVIEALIPKTTLLQTINFSFCERLYVELNKGLFL